MLVALKPDQNVKAICEMLLSWVPPQVSEDNSTSHY